LGRIRPTAPQRVRYTASYTTRCRNVRELVKPQPTATRTRSLLLLQG